MTNSTFELNKTILTNTIDDCNTESLNEFIEQEQVICIHFMDGVRVHSFLMDDEGQISCLDEHGNEFEEDVDLVNDLRWAIAVKIEL